jgi:hypothetical protein
MQRIISTDVLVAVSEEGFSLDELVYRTRELFESQGLPGFVGLVLRLVDESLCIGLVEGKSRWRREHCCCQSPRYEVLDHQKRRVRTSLGTVCFSWRRLRCRNCGRTFIPLREFLGLASHQAKTSELEQTVLEVVSDQSYRRGSGHLRQIGQIPVPHTTAHRWVAQSECDQLSSPKEQLQTLLADGTGYKRRPDKSLGVDNQGNLRLALGIGHDGRVVPLGSWSGASWEDIAQELSMGSPKDQKLAQILVSDGEPGLHQNLGRLTQDQQRCHWHLVHDLDERMRRDGAPMCERRDDQGKLAGLIRVELPAGDGQTVRPEDREDIQQRVQQAEQSLAQLAVDLRRRGYREAASYVELSRKRVFGYVRLWLETGLISPRASSFIERLMREVARRLKRIAFGWSQKGAAKMARIILKRFASRDDWNNYWKERLNIRDRVLLVLRKITAQPCPQIVER